MKKSPLCTALALIVCFLFPPSLAVAGSPSDLIGHWTFDTNANSSVGGWTGSIQSQAQVGSAGAFIGSGCYYRDSGEGYVQTNLTGPTGSAARAISIWFKTDSDVGSLDTLCGWGSGAMARRYDFRLNGGDLRIEIAGTGVTMPLTPKVNDGRWHHALLSFTGGNFSNHKLYVDGRLAGSTSSVGTTVNTDTSTKLRIGTGVMRNQGSSQTARDFDGWLDDFGIFNKALHTTDAALVHGLGRLGLDLFALQNARNLWAGPAGGTVEISGTTWEKCTGLVGSPGDFGGSLAAEDAFVVLDNAGNGIAVQTESLASLDDYAITPSGPHHLDIGFGHAAPFSLSLTNNNPNLDAAWQLVFNGGVIVGPDWILPEQSEGRVAANNSGPINFTLATQGMEPGNYATRFAVVPAGTAAEDVPADDWQDLSITVTEPSFELDTYSLSLTSLAGFPTDAVTLQAIPTEDAPPLGTLSAASPASWIAATASATNPGLITLDFTSETLPPNTCHTTLEVWNGATKRVLVVTLKVAELNIAKLLPDPKRPNIVYGIHYADPDTHSCRLLRIDAASGLITDAIEVGRRATDFDIDPTADLAYVANYGFPTTQRIDLASFTALPPLDLGGHIECIEVDGRGHLYSSRTMFNGIRVWNLTILESVELDGSSYYHGDIALSSDGRFLFQASPTGILYKYDVAIQPAELTASSGKIDTELRPLILSADGSTTICGNLVFDSDTRLISELPDTAQSISPDSELAAGENAIWWTDSGATARTLPFTASVSAFTADAAYFVAFVPADSSFHSIPVGQIADLPGPWPRPGQRLDSSPQRFTWQGVPGATSYKLTIAGNPAGVHIFPGLTETSFTLPTPLPVGRNYSWRVDAITPENSITPINQNFSIGFPEGSQITNINSSNAGSSVALGRNSFMIGGEGRAFLNNFDPATGKNQPLQTLSIKGLTSSHNFGYPVVLEENTAVVGAIMADISATNAGAFYSYSRSVRGLYFANDPTTAPEPLANERFAQGLAASGNILLAGGGRTSSRIVPGRVVVYLAEPSVVPTQIIQPVDSRPGDNFGCAIAIHGNTAVVSAPHHDYPSNPPTAYVFDRNTETGLWSQTQKLALPTGSSWDKTGSSVAISDSVIAINRISDTGHVYTFIRNSNGTWMPAAKISGASVPGSTDRFADCIALHGDLLMVGDPKASFNDTTYGVVYTFRRNDTIWTQSPPIVPRNLVRSDFGTSLAARDGWLIVGGDEQAWCLRIDDPDANRSPFFISPVPSQAVSGRLAKISVQADDPDGTDGLVIEALQLPLWLSITDEGSGRATLTGIPTALPGSSFDVQLKVGDPVGGFALRTFRLTLFSDADVPRIITQPVGADLGAGQELILRGAVEGIGPFAWQWQHDGADIPGATDPILNIPEAVLEDTGTYTFTVTNVVAIATSHPAVITVRPANRFAGPWPTFGGSPRHAGFHPATLGRHTFTPAWSVEVENLRGATQRPAIAEGKVFVTPYIYFRGTLAMALDLATGSTLWSHPFNDAFSINPPSYHNGRVFFQRCNGDKDTQLWCLEAETGTTVWSTPHVAQFPRPEAPAVTDEGIWVYGGYSEEVYGFTHDGTHLFSEEVSARNQNAPGTPTVSSGRLFTSADSSFTEHIPNNGTVLWSINTSTTDTAIPVISGSRTALVKNNQLSCIDIDERRIVWTSGQPCHGEPAIAANIVYAIDSTMVRTFSLADGTPGPVFTAPRQITSEQPLLLNDHLIVASDDRIFVFDLASGDLVQTLEGGGKLAYSDGYLLAAGTDGTLRAFFANAAPEFTDSMPPEINSGDAAGDLLLALAPFAGDPDPGDPLSWAIVSVSNTELFRTLEVDPVTGDLTVIYNPWQSGTSDVVISITDSAGNVTETTITFTVPEHPEPQIDMAASLVLNRQTGLYEHTITVTNSGAREVAGFDLTVTGLPEGVCVWNASDCTKGPATIQHRQPLAAGASVTLILEYYAPVRGTVLDPEVAVSLVTEPESDPAAPDGGFAIDRCLRQADGSMLIEFTVEPGALYEIHYSDDGENWKLSPVRIRAAGNRVQWIDRGPPRTDTPPSEAPTRFYKVRKITETNK